MNSLNDIMAGFKQTGFACETLWDFSPSRLTAEMIVALWNSTDRPAQWFILKPDTETPAIVAYSNDKARALVVTVNKLPDGKVELV